MIRTAFALALMASVGENTRQTLHIYTNGVGM